MKILFYLPNANYKDIDYNQGKIVIIKVYFKLDVEINFNYRCFTIHIL